jgi:catechol 2,3-dioxygenase-like lactoylglutathione lyase family enzyme
MKMSVGVLDHYNVSTRKLDETVHFYENVLGFTNGPRPPFNFPGAWLYSSGHPVLHLNDISQTEKQQRSDSGVIDHVAFGCRGFEATKRHLSGMGIQYHVNQCQIVPGGRFFCAILTTLRSSLISRARTKSASNLPWLRRQARKRRYQHRRRPPIINPCHQRSAMV